MSTANSGGQPKREPLKPPHRRLVLMFDGTGNKRLNLSNVARMFEAIDDSVPRDYATYQRVGSNGPCGTCGLPEELEPDQEPVQLLRYIKGVGTDFFGHLSGLGFGYGLSANVKEGYVWLSNNYREGDEIFVFGFSRGAFSARSLVSLVHRCGGVLKNVSVDLSNKPELKDSDSVVVKAYAMYQAYVQTTDSHGQRKSDPAVHRDFYDKFQSFAADRKSSGCGIHKVKVKMLGVWDTVGAVGLLETGIKLIDDNVYPLSRYGRRHYQFHDQGLSCIVENAYHALAIDEHRRQFEPTLWDKVTPENQEVKQVWFAGSHCNVGGGADLEDLKDPDDLWLYSYVWMQRHAAKHGLRFYWTYDSPATQKSDAQGKPIPTRRVSLRTAEDSWKPFLHGLYAKFSDQFYRNIDETNGSKLHWSVKDRIEQSVNKDREFVYLPESLFGSFRSVRDRFTRVGADMFEIEKIDADMRELVSKKLWQIETDEVMTEPSRPPLHILESVDCGCDRGLVAPPKVAWLWSLLGYWFVHRYQSVSDAL